MKTKCAINISRWALCLLAFSPFTGLIAADTLPKVFEAETDATVSAYTLPRNAGSGFNDVIGLESAWGSYAQYTINVETAGTYDLKFTYLTMDHRWAAIAVNNQVHTPVDFSDLTSSWNIGDAKTLTIPIYLEAGDNTIRLEAYKTKESPEFDKLTISASAQSITKPADQISKIVLEAETANVLNNAVSYNGSDWSRFSGGAGVKDMSSDNNSYAQFNTLPVTTSGTYDISIFYTSGENRSLYIKAGNKIRTIVTTNKNTDTWEGNNQSDIDAGKKPGTNKITTAVYLEAGDNLKIGAYNGWGPNLDKIEILKSAETLTNPGTETTKLASVFDYTDLATLTGTGDLSALNDNDELTVYTVAGQTTTQIKAELPYPIILTGYAIASTNQPVMDNWVVEYSSDGITWNSLGTLDKTTQTDNFRMCQTSILFANTEKAAKYYRLTATGTTNVEIAEWQLFGSPYISSEKNFPDHLSDLHAGTLTASAAGWGDNGEEGFAKVFDKLLSTRYTVTGNKSFWLTYDMEGTSATVTHYSLSPRDANSDRNPKDWTLQGSNDGSTWTELDKRSEVKFPVRGATLILNVTNPGAYSQYKLDVTNNAGSGDIQLMQWQLFVDNNNPTSISESVLKNNNMKIFGSSRTLTIVSDQVANYSVYSMLGQQLLSGKCKAGQTDISLPEGLYIVKAANTVAKVLVK